MSSLRQSKMQPACSSCTQQIGKSLFEVLLCDLPPEDHDPRPQQHTSKENSVHFCPSMSDSDWMLNTCVIVINVSVSDVGRFWGWQSWLWTQMSSTEWATWTPFSWQMACSTHLPMWASSLACIATSTSWCVKYACARYIWPFHRSPSAFTSQQTGIQDLNYQNCQKGSQNAYHHWFGKQKLKV